MKPVVFTDLDATLLDPVTYDWLPAQEALSALRMRSGALVLVSSKTHAEMAPLHHELGFGDPFIVENGGGIALSEDAPEQLIESLIRKIGQPIRSQSGLLYPLGVRYTDLVQALNRIEVDIGHPLRGFASMSIKEVTSLTGLSTEEAARSLDRCFDEPFLASQDPETSFLIEQAAKREGLSVVLGGRFWHLIGHPGKGEAVRLLIRLYQDLFGSIVTVGLGDSPNDFSFLELMDISALLGHFESTLSIPSALTGIKTHPHPGPAGWNQMVLGILDELKSRK